MDSINHPAKKRKAVCDPPPTHGHDDPRTALSLADLNRLIDQRVYDAVERKTLALTLRVDDLQRENEALLLRCESLERSVQVLKEEGNWTYSAPDVLESHWIEQGRDDDYADEAESLIQAIADSTHDLRLSGGEKVAVFGGGTPISSDNVLNPHWDELSNAIQLSERVTTLDLKNVQLDQRTLQIIEASARQKGLKGVTLARNQFHGSDGVQFAIDVLKSNRSVEMFSWCRNAFHSTEAACKIVDAVLEHPMICRLHLTSSLSEDIARAPLQCLFGGVGTNTLQAVNLIGNGIKTNGGRCISDFLSTNPPLERLNLNGNQLNDDDALHIALALQSNNNLRYLNLGDNALTIDGKPVMIYQAIWGVSRSDLSEVNSVCEIDLNTVSEANHTCEIREISDPTEMMNRHNKTAKSNRGKKMFCLLQMKYSKGFIISQLEREFLEDGLGLVPHVLACINTYSRDYKLSKCLSVLFELARNWKTPEIYQFHKI